MFGKKKRRDFSQVSPLANVILNIVISVFSFMCVFPFILIVMVSITDENTLAANGYRLIPEKFSLFAYEYVLQSGGQLIKSYGVTIFVTVVGTIISLLITALYAYAIFRKQFEYRKTFTFIAFFTMLFNPALVPSYMIATQTLHLRDTVWGLILPLALNAFHILILRTFFQTTVPVSIIESAQIDGAGEFETFFRIILPISLPGLATIALFSTLGYWNDWFNALLYIDEPDLAPLQYMLMRIQNSMDFLLANAAAMGQADLASKLPAETSRMAMVVLATGPIVLAYPFFQRYFVQGLTVGAVKE